MRPAISWAGRSVLVTGATGLVGSWLVKELLSRQARVIALVRDMDPQSELLRSGDVDRIKVVNGQLEELETLERAVIDNEVRSVFHLGAQAIVGAAHRAPIGTLEANVRGTYNLLEACRRGMPDISGVVVASSDKAYGEQTTLPYTEDMPLQGRQIYEVSKSCADLLTQAYHASYGLPVAIARCGNIYGGGDLNWDRIVPGTIRAFLDQQRPVIRSDGSYLRDYVYVKDAARAYIRLAEAMGQSDVAGKAFNFGNERPSTVMEVVNLISGICKADGLVPDIRNTATGEIHSQYLSSERARKVLDWHPDYELEAGLTETVGWYREFLGK
ncbi:MAG: NAD-dependent epimerase/dehydratase family protein [Chloroflexi bacterium]|nr:NAD-dependent epimerase/dehydratase family protein [Chloroflexota bacterium]